ncbi:V-type ATPase subunit [Fusibacter sp. 3D3]|uniref:V-type ATPase subunit n=1 Tax=Fusibacter sp. 3D3 TaxID=1048380 RepID=UPI0008537894|nr:V-type ATPase subunit [Fusibacter sp. 3D3]GAU77900.1 V-type ATP synthase subunit C [Fusibacter sp. 3D3]
MYKVRTHAASNAKSKAILGRLLKEADYLELLKLEKVEEVIEYLKRYTHYSEVFSDIGMSIGDHEVVIKKYFFNTYEKLYHFYMDAYRNFFKAMFCRYEVENLKLFIRVLSRNEPLSDLRASLIYSELYSNLNYDQLEKAVNMQDLLDMIGHTIYYEPLVVFLEEDSEHMIFHMEMVLDRCYFSQLRSSIEALKSEDRELMLELLGINVDILNVQWIYRGRQFFDISSEELFNFTLEGGRRYDYKILKELCYMGFDAFRSYILGGDYSDIFQDREYMMERAMERHLFYRLDEYIKSTKLSIALPVVLLFKFEYEMRDLFTLMEGKKYQFENLKDLLIRELGRA